MLLKEGMGARMLTLPDVGDGKLLIEALQLCLTLAVLPPDLVGRDLQSVQSAF